ncbi:WD repeat-containing protein 26 [Thelotrema lepadinum]|nr:WD repeat-containing protein 26 [Thelotrema lepadinum]
MRFTTPTVLTLLFIALSASAYHTSLYARDQHDISERGIQKNDVYARAFSALIADALAAREAEADAFSLPEAQDSPKYEQMQQQEPHSWIPSSPQSSGGKKGKSSSKKSSSKRRSAESNPEASEFSVFTNPHLARRLAPLTSLGSGPSSRPGVKSVGGKQTTTAKSPSGGGGGKGGAMGGKGGAMGGKGGAGGGKGGGAGGGSLFGNPPKSSTGLPTTTFPMPYDSIAAECGPNPGGSCG